MFLTTVTCSVITTTFAISTDSRPATRIGRLWTHITPNPVSSNCSKCLKVRNCFAQEPVLVYGKATAGFKTRRLSAGY
ncbi:hypothetical protein BAUCODRAFT_283952 [Baudoinia panamericana UAMH 10762]|uniref:Secreted protein n=1 Tax=Baudoinia panamericana (strain UAMH 10762) TaxID=717646 RepID=M2LE65_BAUPA|nr:uncharacterized protein BAUCODRAFT_283952 [Baudoinia panamericana UAMH 10762]EMC92272.1 hypothetical protein BAUCODRAFT_283952 [Baudoinia panamericana UAMH 10762]